MRNALEGPGVDSQSPFGSAPRSPQSDGAGDHSSRGAAPCGHSPEQDSEQLCGWGPLRPRALQVFNSPRWALFFLSMASFLQGFLVNGLVNTVVTSIERRFDLSSSQSGLIVSSFDIASCICLPFMSYFGGQGHRPRWLGWGMVLMGLGSLVFALPHFTSPPYQATAPETSDLCPSNTALSSELRASDGLSHYFYVFILGQLLHGIGSTPLFTLGFTFLDENVKPVHAPVYMGVFYTAASLGPALGFLLGGILLSFYTEISLETELAPESPLWVGAWWIGFVLAGALSLPVAFAILGYPKKLPGSPDPAASRQSEDPHSKDGRRSPASNLQFVKTLRAMLSSLLLLLTNPTFMFVSLAAASFHGLKSVMTTFTPKFFESQFSFSSSQAALIFGAIIIPATGVATLLGSYFVKRFKLHCRGMLRFCVACALVLLLSNFMFLVHCPTASMAGVTAPYSSGQPGQVSEDHAALGLSRSAVEDELVAQCNSNCSCDRRRFSPVCGADDVMYYSPCFAGCTSTNLSGSGEIFSGCRCVEGNVSLDLEGLAVAGKCDGSCPYTPIFITIFAISTFCLLFFSVPNITATLRCVPETQKSFALGIHWILVRTLGVIPGPIVFGSLLDQACLLKQSEDQGSCYFYENFKMSRFTLITLAVYEVLGAAFFVLALVFCEAPPAPAPVGAESSLQSRTPPDEGAVVKDQTRL